MKSFMYMVGYDQSFQKTCSTGWGCGYVVIPATHPLVIEYNNNIAKQVAEANDNPDEYTYIDKYLQIPEFSQETTYTEPKTINGDNYLVVGFDTAHLWNSAIHNFEYVFSKAFELLQIVESLDVKEN